MELTLLGSSAGGVEVGSTVLNVEGGEVGLGVARSVLGAAEPEAVQASRDTRVLDGRARVDGNTAEVGVGSSGGSASGGEDSDGSLGEHFGGCWKVDERKCSKVVKRL